LVQLKKIAVAGLGSVGFRVAAALDRGEIPGLKLVAVSARSLQSSDQRLNTFSKDVIAADLRLLGQLAEIVVECLPPSEFMKVAESVLRKEGSTLVVASVGALLENSHVIELSSSCGSSLVAPSGAVAGLDALRAAKWAGLKRVQLITSKPPSSFGTKLCVGTAVIETSSIYEKIQIFSGSAREAVKAFPKNINVAATVSLAGVGPDKTEVEIWVDPALKFNTHELKIWSKAGEVSARSTNHPDEVNPKSSAVTAYSVLACLQKITNPFAIGS